jgi:hypothetical protein
VCKGSLVRGAIALATLTMAHISCAQSVASLSGGTYRLDHDTQQIGGQHVEFNGLPTMAVAVAVNVMRSVAAHTAGGLRIGAELANVSYDFSAAAQSGHLSATTVSLRGEWSLPVSRRFDLYLGGTVGGMYAATELYSEDIDKWAIAASVLAGATLPMPLRGSDMALFVEVRRCWEGIDGVSVDGVAAMAGIRAALR